MIIMDINELLIEEDWTMLQVMERLDITSKRVLFVAENGVLTAAVTDGDIRRWIMAKGNIDAKVKDFANYNPKFIYEEDEALAEQYMKKSLVGALPIVDKDKRIISIAFLSEKDAKSNKQLNIPAVIMAGGLGTRLYPYTKILPKPLIPVGELPIAEHIINRFKAYGCNSFYLIVNHKKNMIKAYFNEIERDYELTFVDEEKPLGTGGGVSLLKGKINSTFILTNCDILIDEDFEKIYSYHKESKNLITMVCSLKKFTIPYGVVEIGENGDIVELKEKPEMSFFTNTGCYIVEPSIIYELEENCSIGFPEIIERYKNQGCKIGIYPIRESSWMDMGQLEALNEMRKRLDVCE